MGIGAFFKHVMDYGPNVVLPFFIFLVALVLGTKPGKAFRAAVFIAIALIGIKMVTGFMGDNLGPAMKAMIQHSGLHLDVIDVGWGAVAASIWQTPMGAIGIPILLGFNILLILGRVTKTLMIDIWNYHHLVTAGVLTYVTTGNVYLGFAAMLVAAFLTWWVADWSAPFLQRFYGLPGISMPTLSSAASLVIAAPLNALIDMIPGVKNIKGDFSSIRKYMGIFGEPAILAVIIGLAIGALARYTPKDMINLAMNLAAVMIILPKVVAILMEGLMPISEASREFLQKKFGGRDLYLGLDSAISIGHPSVLTAALILTPFTLLLAAVLPGNRLLPFADITVIPFRVAFIVALVNGNVFRTLVIGAVVLAQVLLAGTITSPALTKIFLSTGGKVPAGAVGVSSFSGGSLFITYSIVQIFSFAVTGAIIAVVVWALFFLVAKSQQRKAVEAIEASQAEGMAD
ncbi:MAG: PTS galactitol transporter subunit IIC [Mycobacterium leprae]